MLQKRRFSNCYEAQCFLESHPAFKDQKGLHRFEECFSWSAQMVSPFNGRIANDPKKNTKQVFWLAISPWIKPDDLEPYMRTSHPDGVTHTVDRIVASDITFESSMIQLAEKIQHKFGNYEEEKE
jgi:hypothetical protein